MQTLFSTAQDGAGRSFQRWRETITERIIPVELTNLGERPFQGTLEADRVGGLAISRVTQSAIRTETTPATIRRNVKHDVISVVLVAAGTVTSSQDGREAVQSAGDLMLLDRRRPILMATQAESRTLLVEIPRQRVECMLGATQLYTALTVGAPQASASLVTTFFDELLQVHERLSCETAERMALIGVDLLIASLAERLARDVPKAIYGDIVVQRAKAHVESHLSDPTLDPPRLAAAVGVSLRRLQQLFHDRDHHISEWIWQRRLAVAARQLESLGHRHLSIGMVAYSCGFVSQAHFSRLFKERFDMTPTEYRRSKLRMLDASTSDR